MRRGFRSGRHPQYDQFRFRSCRLVQIACGIGLEFFRAACAAKVEFLAAVLERIFRRRGIHLHAAHWIFFQSWGWAGSGGIGWRHLCAVIGCGARGFGRRQSGLSKPKSAPEACAFDCRYTILDSARPRSAPATVSESFADPRKPEPEPVSRQLHHSERLCSDDIFGRCLPLRHKPRRK